MIGMCCPVFLSCSRICAVACRPSISGIWMSIRIRSNGSWHAASTACFPFPLTDTANPCFSSGRTASFWFTGLSSAKRIRSLCPACGRGSVWRVVKGIGDDFESARLSVAASAAINSASLTGFVKYPAIPSSRQRAASLSCRPPRAEGRLRPWHRPLNF